MAMSDVEAADTSSEVNEGVAIYVLDEGAVSFGDVDGCGV
jgi:hypothetical protein